MDEILFSAVTGLGVSATLIGIMLTSGLAHRLALDHPNDRSLHEKSIPRSGGLGIMCAILVWNWLAPEPQPLPTSLALLLAGISWLDDRHNLGVTVRLTIHVTSAVLCVLVMMSDLSWPLATVLILALVWSMNLYNFMDGANGLAGGMTAIGFGFLGLAAYSANWMVMAAISVSVAMAALGFLFFNFGQAKIFMGDCGSVPLGFLASTIGALGWYRDIWPATFPILVFFPFIADASITLLRRLMQREAFWRPHREHYYQRLIRMGWSHRKTALAYYVWMAASGLSGLASIYMLPIWAFVLLGAWLVTIALIFRQVNIHWQERNQNLFL